MDEELDGYDKVVYFIDKNNVICEIGEGWDGAARTGNAPDSLNHDQVIDNPISYCMSDDNTRMYYDAMFKLCRLRNETLMRDYRCDSSTHQRFMRVILIPLEDGRIKMVHSTIREEPFDHPITLIDHGRQNHKGSISRYVKRCSMCNKLRLPGADNWTAPEEVTVEREQTLNVIHAICENCNSFDWRVKPET
ncbi:MAG: hypothetical protein R6V18_09535 [Desulfuromonadaceae bacterium]